MLSEAQLDDVRDYISVLILIVMEHALGVFNLKFY